MDWRRIISVLSIIMICTLGTGTVFGSEEDPEQGITREDHAESEACYSCDGTGQISCPICGGTGILLIDEDSNEHLLDGAYFGKDCNDIDNYTYKDFTFSIKPEWSLIIMRDEMAQFSTPDGSSLFSIAEVEDVTFDPNNETEQTMMMDSIMESVEEGTDLVETAVVTICGIPSLWFGLDQDGFYSYSAIVPREDSCLEVYMGSENPEMDVSFELFPILHSIQFEDIEGKTDLSAIADNYATSCYWCEGTGYSVCPLCFGSGRMSGSTIITNNAQKQDEIERKNIEGHIKVSTDDLEDMFSQLEKGSFYVSVNGASCDGSDFVLDSSNIEDDYETYFFFLENSDLPSISFDIPKNLHSGQKFYVTKDYGDPEVLFTFLGGEKSVIFSGDMDTDSVEDYFYINVYSVYHNEIQLYFEGSFEDGTKNISGILCVPRDYNVYWRQKS